nr:MAG TPA: major tail protein [Caudoviricetes sp.]
MELLNSIFHLVRSKKIMKYNLQMFAETVSGKKLVYLFRILKNAATAKGTMLAFTTENSRTKSKDADSKATKDGTVRTPGQSEVEISATSLLSKGDTFVSQLEDALDNDDIVEVWEVNLEEKGTGTNKFKSRYFQGYLTEVELSSDADENVEVSLKFGINGAGVVGDATVTTEQQKMAAYVFKDTTQGGA